MARPKLPFMPFKRDSQDRTGRWRDPTVGRMIPTRIGQGLVIVLAALTIGGAAKAWLTDTDTTREARAAEQAVYEYEQKTGSPEAANALVAQIATQYTERWLRGLSTEGLTLDSFPRSRQPLSVQSVRVHSILPGGAPVEAGALYLVTVIAVVDPPGSEVRSENWYQIVVLVTAAREGPDAPRRAVVATAGQPLTPAAVPLPQVWLPTWERTPDPQLLQDLKAFFASYLADNGRLDVWVPEDSDLVPIGRFPGAEVNIISIGTSPAPGNELAVRVLIDVGQVYEYAVRVRSAGPRFVVTQVDPVPLPKLAVATQDEGG